ncbi:MAG TPA: carotenoid 1,2-hydratase, partial [Gammaproteobacteria bacterium]
IEWWYATGWLQAPDRPTGVPAYGLQLTFFRMRTGLAQTLPSRFAARQLLFAHAALTDLAGRRQLQAERIARWSGDEATPRAAASSADTRVHLRDWRLERSPISNGSGYATRIADDAAGFAFTLTLDTTQPLLLQGDAGWSRKGPAVAQASHYYSQPQLAVAGELHVDGRMQPVRGQAWLDHEWSESLLDAQAVGWDWIGINLFDGGALTAFVLRRADGSALWAGGSHRAPGAAARVFGPDEVHFAPGRRWNSAASRAAYPVQWTVQTPLGRYRIDALLDAQELDSRASTGAFYWEGLSELRDEAGQRIGLGYLEMTGYAARLRL